MIRVTSISFVLRAGVKYTLANKASLAPSDSYRTVQARVDSILYSRLKLAERDLFRRLQALIFRTAGCLNKDQQYPVALVMWQLMRMMSIGASHLSNIVDRFGNNGTLHETRLSSRPQPRHVVSFTDLRLNSLRTSRSPSPLSTTSLIGSSRSLPYIHPAPS
jgi:hypothetical protein